MVKFLNLFIVLLLIIFSGCGSSGYDEGDIITNSPVKLDENFESYALTLNWSSPNWSTTGTSAIINDSTNKVLSASTAGTTCIYDGYIGDNYTLSAKFKLSTLTARVRFYSHYSGLNAYALYAESPAGLMIYKKVNGTDNAITSQAYSLSTGIWYTVTLKFSNNIVTGTITDGISSQTTSFNDNGLFYGTALAQGKSGIANTDAAGTYFDDIKITEP